MSVPHFSERLLEFDVVREILRAYIASAPGRGRVAALAPSLDKVWIERQQRLTAEVRAYWRTGGRFDFSGIGDCRELLGRARIAGSVLELAELREVLNLADRAQAWRQVGLAPPESLVDGWPAVAELTRGLADFAPLLGYFKNKILPDGTLDDRASPELARLRREIEKQKRAIQESLRRHLRALSEDGAVQDELITIRGERFVIPVRVEQKRKVSGVVHGASSSGQTIFVEPMETIEQNNELVRLLEEELAEVHRILAEMTRRIAESAPELAEAQEALAEVELQFAKARFAEDYTCCTPEFTAGRLAVEKARHPGLERNLRTTGKTVVPIAVELDEKHRQLIISGPNTGGKTVGLKTLGLLALMAQAGVPVPAERAEFPVFDGVRADIGDYQSIEQNLSTFSAHVTNMDRISREATPRSLVLLDELGSATDPEEGAALAVAIAEHFRRIGCITIISTHHSALKVYAANTEGVLNASVGFDEKTLQPTYHLRVGVPGASAGINIAQQLGLNPEIIAAARRRVGTQAQDVAHFLDTLQQEVSGIERERVVLRQREAEVEKEKKRLAADGQKDERKKFQEMERKLDGLLRDFEYQAREMVKAVEDRAAAQKLSKDAERRISRLRREFKDQFDSAVVAHRTGADVGDPHSQPREVKYVGEGDVVKLKSMGARARIERRVDDQTFEVTVGNMKMRISRGEIAEVIQPASREQDGAPRVKPLEAARARGIQVSLADESSAASEINVIGQTVDEATGEVEKFIDRAFLAGLGRVRIVHGSGMGKLRKALREYLKKHPHVESVAEPPQSEGGAGATVVELRG